MSQYYQFINRTRREVSQISLPFNFGMPYAKALERYGSKEVEAMFRFVVKHNPDWSIEDELMAQGDYGEVITFESVKQPQEKYDWESYEPKSEAPLPLQQQAEE